MGNRFVWLIVTMLFCLSAFLAPAFCAAPSKYTKNQVIYHTGKIEANAKNAIARFERFKSKNELDAPDGSSTRGIAIAKNLRGALTNAIFAYIDALNEGWPESDPDMAKAKTEIESWRTRFEAMGMWTSFQFGESPIRRNDINLLDNIHDTAWYASIEVKQGQVDEGASTFMGCEQRFSRIKKDYEKALDRGDTQAVDLEKHPAYARTRKAFNDYLAEAEPAIEALKAKRDAIVADVNALIAMNQKTNDFLSKVGRASNAGGSEEEALARFETFLTKLEAFEKDPLPELKEMLKDFGEKYGTSAMNINNGLRALMGPVQPDYAYSPGSVYENMAENVAKIKPERQEIARRLLKRTKEQIKRYFQYDEGKYDKDFKLYAKKLAVAVRADPENREAKELLDHIDAKRKEAWASSNAKIDAEKWPGNSDRFQGPGDPDDLIQSAIEWFKKSDWTENKDIIGVRITGDWYSAEENILGQTTQWGLPIEAAFVYRSDKSAGRDVAWAYTLTLVTRDAEKKPPWARPYVGDNRWLRPERIKGGAIGGSGKAPFIIFRLGLSLILLLAGLMAATPLIRPLHSKAAALLDKLAPFKAVAGVSTLGLGALFFIKNLLLLSPMADLLPQAAAMVIGLFLGMELLLRKPAPSAPGPEGAQEDMAHKAADKAAAAAIKAQELLARHQGRIAALEKFQGPMGIAAMVLGLLHLFFAGWILF